MYRTKSSPIIMISKDIIPSFFFFSCKGSPSKSLELYTLRPQELPEMGFVLHQHHIDNFLGL